MQAELRRFIEKNPRFYKATVLRVAEMLPPDDAALDELIGELVAAANQTEFVYVVTGALITGRPVSVRHLPRGTLLMPHWFFLGWITWHMTGELAEPLLAAVEQTQLSRDAEATALYIITVWCQQHRQGVLPDGVLARARALARLQLGEKAALPQMVQMIAVLRVLTVLTQDAGLTAILTENYGAANVAGIEKFRTETLAQCFGEMPGSILPAIPSNILAHGTTMRRSVPRMGRNEPCRCGSGKKYKRCCHDEDQERLHHSSEVAGHTREQVEASPEQHLTSARMDKTSAADLLRMDATKVPAELLEMYFIRLAALNLFERVAEGLERLGFSEGLKETWLSIMRLAARSGRNDVTPRLLAWHPDAVQVEKELRPCIRLLLAQDDPPRLVKLLEELSLKALQTEDSEALEQYAYGVLECTKLNALGIFVARSLLPVVKESDAMFLFNQILEKRDKLNLSPEDPFGDIVDRRFASHTAEKESAELHKARQKLEAKAQEVQHLKESLGQMQKEIVRREQKIAAHAQTPAVAAPPRMDDAALKELRRKVVSFKSALKERHHERNDLRRELQKAHADLEILQQTAAPSMHEETEAFDHEEELLLPQDAPEVHPVRLIEFPKGFQQTLAAFPRHVARAAMILCGRLAAGEPAAFVGALRLKQVPNVMRQRIGSDYRLFFWLHPGHVQIIDLINRKDLQRWLKTLG